MLCHSVLSCRLPSRSFHCSDVAIEKFATALPVWVKRTSGSLPRLPMRITLLTDMLTLHSVKLIIPAQKVKLNLTLPIRRVNHRIGVDTALSHVAFSLTVN